MIVNIYSDASIKLHRGYWGAVVIRFGHVRQEWSGTLRGTFGSSAAVEAAAAANAIHVARRAGLIERGDIVWLRTDNLVVVDRINLKLVKVKKVDPAILSAISHVHDAAVKCGVELHAEWVKGHQRLDSTCPHSLHNRRCDQLASAARDGRKAPDWGKLVYQFTQANKRRELSATP